MKLTDQEQVILKAIGSGVAEVSRVIRAVGYPKATVKKVLVRLNEKGIVALHRHDYPSSLTSDQRKMMVKIGSNYYGAVSVRKKNPKRSLPEAWQVKKLSWGGFAWQSKHDYDDDVYKRDFSNLADLEWYLADHYGWPFAKKVIKAAQKSTGEFIGTVKRNPGKQSKGKTALKKTGRALKGFAQGALSSAAQILGAGAEALNPLTKWEKAERAQHAKYRKKINELIAKGWTFDQIKNRVWNLFGLTLVSLSEGKAHFVPLAGVYGKDFTLDLAEPKRGRKANPRGKHLPGLPAKAQREYEKILREAKKSGRYKGREKEVAARTVRKQYGKNKTVIRAGRIDHLDVSKVHNPRKRKAKRNAAKGKTTRKFDVFQRRPEYIGTPSEWGKLGTYSASSASGAITKFKTAYKKSWGDDIPGKYELRAVASNPSRKRNASTTRSAASTAKRRAGASSAGRKTKKTSLRSVAKTRKASTRRASSNPTRKGMRKLYREAKRISKITRGRYFSSESGQRKAARHEKQQARKSRRNPDPKHGSTTKAERLSIARQTIGSSPVYVFKWMGKWHQSLSEPPLHSTGVVILYPDGSVKSQKKNPSAESIRKTFAGSVNGSRDLFFPQGTPSGRLAKLGRLVSITTEAGTIKPIHGTAWLCADTRGKLHIGATSNSPLYSGPARNFGHVTKLEYESSKPHLGYRGPIIWFHKAGEENGVRPTLRADGKGGLVFRGGAYRLTERGIEN